MLVFGTQIGPPPTGACPDTRLRGLLSCATPACSPREQGAHKARKVYRLATGPEPREEGRSASHQIVPHMFERRNHTKLTCGVWPRAGRSPSVPPRRHAFRIVALETEVYRSIGNLLRHGAPAMKHCRGGRCLRPAPLRHVALTTPSRMPPEATQARCDHPSAHNEQRPPTAMAGALLSARGAVSPHPELATAMRQHQGRPNQACLSDVPSSSPEAGNAQRLPYAPRPTVRSRSLVRTLTSIRRTLQMAPRDLCCYRLSTSASLATGTSSRTA